MLVSYLKNSLLGRMLRRSRHRISESVERLLHPPSRQWPHHVLFVAGLPKSGTTWLEQLLAAVPDYRTRWPYDPDGCIYRHDVCESVFAALPKDLYSVIKLHTRLTPDNLAIIKKFNIPTVVMYRDPRDQCVSRYFHVLNDPRHQHHHYYRAVSKEVGMAHCVQIAIEHYVPWINDWAPYAAANPDRFHLLRYTHLRTNTFNAISRVLEFYDIQLPSAEINEIIQRVASQTVFDVAYNLRKRKGTARRGKIGDWRNHLTREQAGRILDECGSWAEKLKDAKVFDEASSVLTAT